MNDDEKRRQYEELLRNLNGPQEDPMMSNEIVQGANTSEQAPSIPMPPIPMSPSPMMSQEPEPPVVMPKGLDVFSRPDTDLAQTLADDGMTPMQLLGREQEGVEDKAAAKKDNAETLKKEKEKAKKDLADKSKIDELKDKLARLEASKLERAAGMDANTNFMNRMLEAGAMANRGIAGRAGHKITGKDPSKLKANAESGLRADDAAKLKKMLADYKMKGGGKEGMTEFQKKSLALREQGLGLRRDKEGRLVKKTEKAIEKQEELSDKEVQQLVGYDTGMSLLKKAQKMSEDTDTGFLSNIQQFSGEMFGNADIKRTDLKMMVGESLAQKVRSLSGTAASDKEREFLSAISLPTLKDNDKQFDAKLKNALQKMEDSKNILLDNIGRQKEGAAKFKKTPKSSNQVERRTQDGRVAIFDADTKEFIKYKD